jgi:hypothetical protein
MIATAMSPSITESAESSAQVAAFAYRQRTFAASDTAGMVKAVEQDDGFALIPGVLNPAEVEAARREIDRLRPFHFDAQAKPGSDRPVDHYKCVFNRSPYWLQYLDRPGVIELAEGTMGNECHIIGMTAWRSHPQGPQGDPSQVSAAGIHSDNWMFPVDEELLLTGKVKVPVTICTAHYYLSDIDLELCPTWIVPGSHMSGKWAQNVPVEQRTSYRGREAQPVLVKAGDVLFFRSEVWHTGSHNQTLDRTRYLLQVHYGQRYIAQKFSPYLDFRFNHDVVASATPRQRRIMGDHKASAYD